MKKTILNQWQQQHVQDELELTEELCDLKKDFLSLLYLKTTQFMMQHAATPSKLDKLLLHFDSV